MPRTNAHSLASALMIGCALALALVAVPAHAQQDVEKQVARMNKKAMEDYDALEFESARKTLIDAVAMLRAAGLDESPVAARTFLNLGILYISGFKDKSRGQQQFVNALKIKPDVKLEAALATPELEELFAQAQKTAGVKAPKPAPAEGEEGLAHTPVEEARAGAPLLVKAQVGADVGAAKVVLFYRAPGQEDFTPVNMKASGREWAGLIPADAMGGRTVQYYLEARDKGGKALMGSGSAPNPYLVTIIGGKAPEVADGEDPLAADRKRERVTLTPKKRMHRFFLFVMPGFGFGYQPAGNATEVAYQYQPDRDLFAKQSVGAGGLSIAPFHLALELGVMATKGFSISALGRFQLMTGANAETQGENVTGPTRKATGAIAGMLRARYRFLSGRVHPYIHLDVGGGQIRHRLDITRAQADGQPLVDRYSAETYNDSPKAERPRVALQSVCPSGGCVDSIALGYVLLGGGLGLWVDVWDYIAVIVDVNVLGAVGVGGGQSGLNIDTQLGVGFHL